MADTKHFGALLVAAAACVGLTATAAPESGRHRELNITGEMQFDAMKRRGTTTFMSAKTAGANPSADAASGASDGTTADESSIIAEKVYLNFGFDLNTNTKAVVQLGGTNYAGANADNTNTGAGTAGGGDSSIAVRIRQAYVELHEVFLPELGFKLGMQDMTLGLDRGDANHFVMDSRNWGKHYQIRDGGRVERSYSTRARGQNLPANSANGFDDLNWNDGGTFAWVANWKQKDLFSAQLFYVQLENEGTGFRDSYLWGVDGKIPLKMVNDKTLATVHAFNVKDSSFVQLPLTAATRIGSGSNFWQYGLGCDVFVQDNFEFYGEAAWQRGMFADNFDLTTHDVAHASGTDIGQEKRQDAYAYYLGAAAKIPGAADFKPSVDVSWWSFSGDDDQNDNKNSGFINYGDNKSTMIVEDNTYGIGLSNNYNVWRVKGSVDFDGLLKKGRKTPFTVSYHAFDVNATRIRSTLAPHTNVGQGDIDPSGFGSEVDMSIAHEYSENVTFKLGYGVFFPGMYVRENSNLGGMGYNGRGTPTADSNAGDGSPATMLLFTTSVKF